MERWWTHFRGVFRKRNLWGRPAIAIPIDWNQCVRRRDFQLPCPRRRACLCRAEVRCSADCTGASVWSVHESHKTI